MTDGILLREASEDITLRKYSAIVIDEAHEMSKDTSILIGMLSRIIRLRETLSAEDSSIRPLKLIIMSATQTVADLALNKNLFPHPPPIVQVEGRQYPVTIHWARRTVYDYLDEAFHKVVRGHRNLPPGSMLVFLTSRKDILTLSSRLKHAFPASSPDAGNSGVTVQLSAKEVPLETEDFELGHPLHAPAGLEEEESEDDTERDDDDDDDDDDFNAPHDKTPGPVHVLPLYSLLPTEEQLRVFEPPPEGARLIVLATNIAETSLTIPGIRYVFDCGRAKERRYNAETGVQSFEIGWISKASANQRTGRAGRTGPGHCYRLYSSAVYERDFPEFTEPEIQRTPLEGLRRSPFRCKFA
jgi:ATP-dependent RNA helicase DHX37/DHR1